MREGLALVLLFLAILSVIALFAPDAGAIVQPWHDLLSTSLGWGIAFAAPLLAGFALMLWMKTMPAERWMAATGAAVFALAILGMFHLVGGDGPTPSSRGRAEGCSGRASAACSPARSVSPARGSSSSCSWSWVCCCTST